ncbi:hypothetical protein R1sor_005976 [Riccia sorocarpa]|uniref:Uncharacterized protein n=1 Tax=Riccia sorocarpa TaxID=122646 RepID=A0ABD3HL33_9MARC
MQQCCVFPDLYNALAAPQRNSSPVTRSYGAEYCSPCSSSAAQLRSSSQSSWRRARSNSLWLSPLLKPSCSSQFFPISLPTLNLRPLRTRVRAQVNPPPSGESEGDNSGDKEVQETLVEILRLETGKVRVNEYVEEQAKYLTDIAETADEEYARIAEEAKRSMDAAGSKVLEEIESKASAFEEELAAARAEIEADEAEFEAFEKDVERARSEGLFFKELYKTVKTKTPEEQEQIKQKAKEVEDTVKKSAGSKSRRVFYGILIFVLTLSIIEAATSGDVQLPKLAIYVLLLLALIVQLTYENMVAGTGQSTNKED